MKMMEKFLNAMKVNDIEDDYDVDDYYEDDEPVAEKANIKSDKNNDEESFDEKRKGSGKVTPIRSTKRTLGGSGMQVCVIKPTSFDDAREITDTLLDNRTVILNLEGLQIDVSQRIVDFAFGSAYAIGGNFQQISNYILIITPSSVDISGDFQEIFSGAFNVPPINNNSAIDY